MKLNDGSLRRRRKELNGYRKHFEEEHEAPSLYCGPVGVVLALMSDGCASVVVRETHTASTLTAHSPVRS